MRFCAILAAAALAAMSAGAEAAKPAVEVHSPLAPRIDNPLTQKVQIGVIVKATGPCKNIVSTMPVPMEWPEQQVEVIAEDLSPQVAKVDYRTLSGGARQMVITIPALEAGDEAKAVVTFQVTRSWLLPPDDTSGLAIPVKISREVAPYLLPSPFIESRHPKIKTLAKEVGSDLEGWAKVEAIYKAVRQKVQYKFDQKQQGALKALNVGVGDCEELTALFIALCRASGIPARSVWVHGHCYPEFYLVDQKNRGAWFPCEPTGTAEVFGGIPNHLPILQKGDNFKDPSRPRERAPYVYEFLQAAPGSQPQVTFIPDRSRTRQTGPAEVDAQATPAE